MPSITYLEDNGPGSQVDQESHDIAHKAPEPPSRYDSSAPPTMSPREPLQGNDGSEFDSVRHMLIAACIMAFASLIVGGVLLSAASVVVAIVASRKVKGGITTNQDQQAWSALKRSSTAAIVISVLALTANIAALIVVYPMLVEAIQSGEYSSILSGTPQVPDTSSTSSTWG